MSWIEVNGDETYVMPSNTYDVSLVSKGAKGEFLPSLIFTDPEAAIRTGREMVRIGELVKARREEQGG